MVEHWGVEVKGNHFASRLKGQLLIAICVTGGFLAGEILLHAISTYKGG